MLVLSISTHLCTCSCYFANKPKQKSRHRTKVNFKSPFQLVAAAASLFRRKHVWNITCTKTQGQFSHRTTRISLEKRLDVTYTRILMRAQNLSWKNHPTKAEIYEELPPISKTVAQRRARFTGQCFRAKDQVIFDLLLWRLPCPRRGNRPLTYVIGHVPKLMTDEVFKNTFKFWKKLHLWF